MTPSILIVIPTRDGRAHIDCVTRIMENAQSVERCHLHPLVQGFSVSAARNAACLKCLREDFTHLMMVDDDVVIPSGALANLLCLRAPVAVGCVPACSPLGQPFINIGAEIVGTQTTFFGQWFEGIVKTRAAGLAVSLIERQVLEDIGFPWFRWGQDRDLYAANEGEEAWFCNRVYQEGHYILAHGDVRCRHTTLTELGKFIDQRPVIEDLNTDGDEEYVRESVNQELGSEDVKS